MRVLVLAATLFAVSSAAQAATTIVGTWVYPDGNCAAPTDTFVVQPMSIATDALVCDFRSVKRDGRRVIWTNGQCSDGSKSWRETVTAVDGARGLTIQIGTAAPMGPFRSCARDAAR